MLFLIILMLLKKLYATMNVFQKHLLLKFAN